MIRGVTAGLLLAIATVALTSLPWASAYGVGVWSGDVDELPPCEPCCRMCPQYPLPELEDAFGEVPEPPSPAETRDIATVSGTPTAKHLPTRSSGEGAKCCNVCPGFGVGHPHPAYASFLETGDDEVTEIVQYQPYGFKMPPCCTTCALKSSGQRGYDRLLNSIGAKVMREAPFKDSGLGAVAVAAQKNQEKEHKKEVKEHKKEEQKKAVSKAPAPIPAGSKPAAPEASAKVPPAKPAADAKPAASAKPAAGGAAKPAAGGAAKPASPPAKPTEAKPSSLLSLSSELDADAESELEEPEYYSFLQHQVVTSARHSLFIGRASVSASNPHALCKIPLTEPNNELCCNACNNDAAIAFPPTTTEGFVADMSGKVTRAREQEEQAKRIVEELLLLTGGNKIKAEEMALKQVAYLRSRKVRESKLEDISRKIIEMRENERERIREALKRLEAGPITPQTTLSIKILAAVDSRLTHEITGNATAMEAPSGMRNFTYMTEDEYKTLQTLPVNQRAAVKQLISDGLLRLDRALRTLPNGTVIPSDCDNQTLGTNGSSPHSQQEQEQAATSLETLILGDRGVQQTTGKHLPSAAPITELPKAIQAAQDLIDAAPMTNTSKGTQKLIEQAFNGDPASDKAQTKFAPTLNTDHALADAVKKGQAGVPAGEGVPENAVKADGTDVKNPVDTSAQQLAAEQAVAKAQALHAQELQEKIMNGTSFETPINRAEHSELYRLNATGKGDVLSAVTATNAMKLEAERLHNETLAEANRTNAFGAVTANTTEKFIGVADPAKHLMELIHAANNPKPVVNKTQEELDKYRNLVHYNVWGNTTHPYVVWEEPKPEPKPEPAPGEGPPKDPLVEKMKELTAKLGTPMTISEADISRLPEHLRMALLASKTKIKVTKPVAMTPIAKALIL